MKILITSKVEGLKLVNAGVIRCKSFEKQIKGPSALRYPSVANEPFMNKMYDLQTAGNHDELRAIALASLCGGETPWCNLSDATHTVEQALNVERS